MITTRRKPQMMSGIGDWIDSVANFGAGLVDVIAGGPQKRERAARAQAEADIAAAEAAEEAARYGYLGEVIQAQAIEKQAASNRQIAMILGGTIVAGVLVWAIAKR